MTSPNSGRWNISVYQNFIKIYQLLTELYTHYHYNTLWPSYIETTSCNIWRYFADDVIITITTRGYKNRHNMNILSLSLVFPDRGPYIYDDSWHIQALCHQVCSLTIYVGLPMQHFVHWPRTWTWAWTDNFNQLNTYIKWRQSQPCYRLADNSNRTNECYRHTSIAACKPHCVFLRRAYNNAPSYISIFLSIRASVLYGFIFSVYNLFILYRFPPQAQHTWHMAFVPRPHFIQGFTMLRLLAIFGFGWHPTSDSDHGYFAGGCFNRD